MSFKRTLFIILFSLAFGVNSGFAQPTVNSVSGSLSHKGSISITGYNFGSKSPAAPRIWDACDAGSTSNLNTHWPGPRYPTCTNPGDSNPITMAYRTNYPAGNSMTMPHSRVSKYISGGVSTCNGSWGPSTASADNVITTGTWEADTLFAMYYYRVSPTFSRETSDYSDNFKELSANGQNGDYLSGSDTYMCFGTGGATPPSSYPGNAQFYGSRSEGGACGCGGDCVSITNPMSRWIHVEALWDNNGFEFRGSDNNGNTWEPNYRGCDKIHEADGTNPTSISIGGFIRWPRASASGNYRYWAALYLDDTYSRVMLGNNSNWDDCDIREPQIPSAWNSNSITCSVNLGAFPSNATAYLFVFDSNDNHNSNGFPVTVGGGGGTTTTTAGDTTPPAPPSGLTVVTTTIP